MYKLILVTVFALAGGNHALASEPVKSLRPVYPAVWAPATKFSDGSKLVTLEHFRGRIVILNVWATWCGPCIKEMPSLDRLSTKMAGDKFVVVAISQDKGGKSEVNPYLERLKVKNVTILYDYSQRAFRDFAIRGLPTTFLISSEGRILARLEGAVEWDTPAIIDQINEFSREK